MIKNKTVIQPRRGHFHRVAGKHPVLCPADIGQRVTFCQKGKTLV